MNANRLFVIWMCGLFAYAAMCVRLVAAPNPCDNDCRQITKASYSDLQHCKEFERPDCLECTMANGGCDNTNVKLAGACQLLKLNGVNVPVKWRDCINCSEACTNPPPTREVKCDGTGDLVTVDGTFVRQCQVGGVP